MKLYYIWDAYCGWCYGFKAILEPFVANHPELEVVVLSGGLFDKGNSIGQYPHIPNANKNIAEIYGVTFGSAYQNLLEEGTHVLNSYHAAIGYSLLREKLPQTKWIALASKVQKAFYQKGQSLSDIQTYVSIAKQFDIYTDELLLNLQESLQKTYDNHDDFKFVRQLGVQSYPTLLLEHHNTFYDLRHKAMTIQELENNFILLKQHLAKQHS